MASIPSQTDGVRKRGRAAVPPPSPLRRFSDVFNSISADRIHGDHGTISHMRSRAKQRVNVVCLRNGNAEFGMEKMGCDFIFIGRFRRCEILM